MLNFKLRSTLMNRPGLLSMAWATLQQIVVAASTYFIILATQALSERNLAQSVPYIVGFAASLILVYIPNTISLVYLQKWRLRSFADFLRLFLEHNAGRTTWAHDRDKSKHEAWLTNEALGIYDNATNLLYQVYSIFASTVLNLLVISVLLDRTIMLWYAAGVAILFVASRAFQKPIAAAAQVMQSSRNDLNMNMLKAWDNIFIGNRYNLSLWRRAFDQRLDAMERAAARYDAVRSTVSGLTVSVSILVIALGNWTFMVKNQENMAVITGLVITFPRQLQIVQNIFAFFNVYLSWSGLLEQFHNLAGALSLTSEPRDVRQFIQAPNISVQSAASEEVFANADLLFESLLQRSPGRYTLRASNGAGKSTLLTLLAERTGDESFYLPSRFADLAFAQAATVVGSDGNRLNAAIREVQGIEGLRFILLDEWDANLDNDNLARIDSEISRLALRHVVIESRHRRSAGV